MLNTDRSEPFSVEPGERIAQLLVIAFAELVPVVAESLAESERGEGGFGSSGR